MPKEYRFTALNRHSFGFKAIKDAGYVDVTQDESFFVEANKEDLSVAYSINR